jgi:Na+-transporting methylmalonyl-CoA/oxaloacetate decarboxylase gamma subunit
MRALFLFGLIVAVIVVIGSLIKRQLTAPISVPSATQGAAKMVKPSGASEQVQHELEKAAAEAAKRIDQVEGKH